ncbi:hypothetical protein EVAR_102009_1 [Eumeta japonica]|uniref:Uncharacterized protein n=1 Tax=Eumeta variegata TaxID=151549 RepID=A0A4C2ABX9_EUMVA|nr:hypothetical protein EVAR_102009_1 [Eumeta japonica]
MDYCDPKQSRNQPYGSTEMSQKPSKVARERSVSKGMIASFCSKTCHVATVWRIVKSWVRLARFANIGEDTLTDSSRTSRKWRARRGGARRAGDG